jgi:ankyrin repeat protein
MKTEESMWFDISYENYDQIREHLKNNEIDPNCIKKGIPLLCLIAETMEVDIAKSLLDRGADVNMRDSYGNTPVMKALAEYDKNDFEDDAMVKLLFKYGASKDAINHYGVSVQKMLANVQKYSGKKLSWFD